MVMAPQLAREDLDEPDISAIVTEDDTPVDKGISTPTGCARPAARARHPPGDRIALPRSDLPRAGDTARSLAARAELAGAVTTAPAFRVEGGNLRAGTRLLRVSGGALVNAQ